MKLQWWVNAIHIEQKDAPDSLYSSTLTTTNVVAHQSAYSTQTHTEFHVQQFQNGNLTTSMIHILTQHPGKCKIYVKWIPQVPVSHVQWFPISSWKKTASFRVLQKWCTSCSSPTNQGLVPPHTSINSAHYVVLHDEASSPLQWNNHNC